MKNTSNKLRAVALPGLGMVREPWTAEEDEYLREIERGVNGQWPTYRQIASWLDADIHRRSVRSPSAVSRRYKRLQERHHTAGALPTASTEHG